jgi:hypothetical protein
MECINKLFTIFRKTAVISPREIKNHFYERQNHFCGFKYSEANTFCKELNALGCKSISDLAVFIAEN